MSQSIDRDDECAKLPAVRPVRCFNTELNPLPVFTSVPRDRRSEGNDLMYAVSRLSSPQLPQLVKRM
jgi:hypothetical protein